MADAEARADFPMLLERDWEVLGYVGLPDKHERDLGLEGEIHNLFQFDIGRPIPRPIPIWLHQSRSQYQVIRGALEPVFRLATKFLLCPASLDWFYWLIYAPRTLTNPLVQHNGDDVYEYRRDNTPKETRRAMARAALQRLAMTHTISLKIVGEKGEDEGITQPSLGYYEEGVNIKDDSPIKRGIRAHTFISRDFMRVLMELTMDGEMTMDRQQNTTATLMMRTKMAVTSIHEFAHSAAMACNLRLLRDFKRETAERDYAAANQIERDWKDVNVNEDIFEDEISAEPGYSWEQFVFGGIIELPDFDPSNPLVLIKWPNFLKGERDLRRGKWKPSATQYIIPKQWILNVNNQKWWNNVVEGDVTALYIKKIVGFRKFRSNLDLDEDWSSSESSEGIWETDRQRSQGQKKSDRVSRLRPGEIIEDPSTSRANELMG